MQIPGIENFLNENSNNDWVIFDYPNETPKIVAQGIESVTTIANQSVEIYLNLKLFKIKGKQRKSF